MQVKLQSIRILATYLPASSGSAKVAGFDISKSADKVREHIGYLPESPPLYEDMTVSEYLKFIARIKNIPTKNQKDCIEKVIEACALRSEANKLCNHLSRGYRQRVGLAQAIIHDPKVVILDEPTSGLDPKQIVEIRDLIRNLGKDHTVLLSTHILPEVTNVCDKVVIINEGKTVKEMMLEELADQDSLENLFLESVSSVGTDEDQ